MIAGQTQVSTPMVPTCKHGEGSRTGGGSVLAEVLGLVAAEEALGLDLGGGTSGELLVKADDTLHAQGIRSGANRLCVAIFVSLKFSTRRSAISVSIIRQSVPTKTPRSCKFAVHNQISVVIRTLGEATCRIQY